MWPVSCSYGRNDTSIWVRTGAYVSAVASRKPLSVLSLGRFSTQSGMATCPRSKGHLTDTHRCHAHPVLRVAEVMSAALLGGIISLLLVAAVDQTTTADSVVVAAGALVGIGLHRALRR